MATLMIQGTTSDAGKSTLVAALCRCLARQNLSVAPFKPQNMALNSAVTEDGGEIGRAQALQAQACGLLPHTDMNPVLLKPCTDIGAQVIVHGRVQGNMSATSYHQYKQLALSAVMESHARLAQAYQYVIVEGAGSPAEINLRDRDIANMGFAEAADCPVIIVADIDRGGVFAHLVGTLALLSESEQARVKGFIINRFRGDISLLESGLTWLEQETGKPVLGVLPYLHDLHLDAEDAIHVNQQHKDATFRVVVPVLPRISNHTDFDALQQHPDIDFKFVPLDADLPSADLIILPGSKAVRDDLQALKDAGWDASLKRHLRYGGKVLGICGGYQMLGRTVSDPDGVEGPPGESQGFALLDCETQLLRDKALHNRQGWLSEAFRTPERGEVNGIALSGYEIHVGQTQGDDCARPMLRFYDAAGVGENTADTAEQREGAMSPDGQVAGCYWHGLFDQPGACNALLRWAGLRSDRAINLDAQREAALDRLADAFAEHVDLEAIMALMNEAGGDQYNQKNHTRPAGKSL